MVDYYEMQNEETSIISYDISVIPNDFNVMTINSLIESEVIYREIMYGIESGPLDLLNL